MKLIHTRTRYEVLSKFSEKDQIKSAGFLWDPETKRWFTTDQTVAERLFGPVEPLVKTEPTPAELWAEELRTMGSRQWVAEGEALRAYQQLGAVAVARSEGLLLADEPGLGKTAQVIAGACLADDAFPMLVVAPLAVNLNWQREIERFAPRPLSTMILRARDPWPLLLPDVVIVHWGIVERFVEDVRIPTWGTVVLDEAHYAKNPGAKRTQAIFGRMGNDFIPSVQARHRIALTGTPVPNHPVELMPIARWLWPSLSWTKRSTFETTWGDGRHLDKLHANLIQAGMLRRRKADVLTELPPKIRQLIPLDPTDDRDLQRTLAEERKALEELRQETGRDPYELVAGLLDGSGTIASLSQLAKIRKATALAKVPYVVRMVRDLLADTPKVLVWAHHHDVVDALVDGLKEFGARPLTGRESQAERQASVDAFQASDGDPRVLVCSITAVGTGITLHRASTAVFAELDWVPGNVTQAEDRCHRLGQQNSVLVQHVVIDGSIEVKIVRALVRKQAIAEAIVDGDKDELSDKALGVETIDLPQWSYAVLPRKPKLESWQVTSIADDLTPEQIAQIKEQLAEIDLRGVWAPWDRDFGSKLADTPGLTPKQAAWGAKLLRGYDGPLATLLDDMLGARR